jgi:hypothetical protein
MNNHEVTIGVINYNGLEALSRSLPINRPGNDPYFIPRLKDDYIMRLPGKGRQSLSELFLMKIRRRSMMTNIY